MNRFPYLSLLSWIRANIIACFYLLSAMGTVDATLVFPHITGVCVSQHL